ncbi:hypothetical protein ACQEUU_04690 [Nonomuraea sp. CA-218870]|uniref:hypothetical protein n=1 Tax=Nonomuraea sp. CA-218870 TaxID=3239998 RepID=UPI003D8EF3B5
MDWSAMPVNNSLTRAEALTVALTSLGTFTGYVQQAEAKVTTMVTIHLGVAALAATQVGGMVPLWTAGPVSAIGAAVLLSSFCAGFFIAGYHLALALRPDLREPYGTNRFGLVRPGKIDRPPASVGKQLEEIQLLIEVLTTVALQKHHRVRRALPWMGLACVSVILWMAVAALAK